MRLFMRKETKYEGFLQVSITVKMFEAANLRILALLFLELLMRVRMRRLVSCSVKYLPKTANSFGRKECNVS